MNIHRHLTSAVGAAVASGRPSWADDASRMIAKGNAAMTSFRSARAADSRERPATTYATPHVRAVARALGVDLSRVNGTGTGGRITPADVRAAAPASAAPNAPRDDAYPSHWHTSATTDNETQPKPRAGMYAGTAYPADWTL